MTWNKIWQKKKKSKFCRNFIQFLNNFRRDSDFAKAKGPVWLNMFNYI